MQKTVFETPVVNSLLRGLSRAGLRLTGWRLEGALPAQAARCVIIGAPHTSNWDMPFTLMAAFALRLNVRWLGKASLFKPPFGGLMRWLGGMEVRRDQAENRVAAAVAVLQATREPLQLVVSPEGTRARTTQWRTGFYYIALGAEIPIVLAYIDYPDKRVGLGPVFTPSADVDRDMAAIKAFYLPFRGRNAGQFDAR
jgi:1-acyl-sn-glycerol-3-phosphate acyltransferase